MTADRPRVCIFCGGGPLSNEHLFPEWASLWLKDDPRGLPKRPRGAMGVMSGAGRPGRDAQRRTWEARVLDIVKTKVCEPCNNGWMSESAASVYLKPMMRGQGVVLDGAAQGTISTWAALKAMIAAKLEVHSA